MDYAHNYSDAFVCQIKVCINKARSNGLFMRIRASYNRKLAVILALVTCASVLLNCFATYEHPRYSQKLFWQELQIDIQHSCALVTIQNSHGRQVYKSCVGRNIFGQISFEERRRDNQTLLIEFLTRTRLTVTVQSAQTSRIFNFLWETSNKGGVFHDDVILSDSHWYGGSAVYHQLWPIELWNRPSSAYITGDSFKDYYGGVQERYWISSEGVTLFVDYDVPLFVGINESSSGFLSMKSRFISPYSNNKGMNLTLNYTVTVADDMLKAHAQAPGRFWKTPTTTPSERMFRHPIWSTWAQYKKSINQTLVLDYARDVNKHGFKNAQIEIDDDWNVHYGDFEFDLVKFPDAKLMIKELKSSGFRVTLWVHPFASILSKSLSIKGDGGQPLFFQWLFVGTPALGIWWNGLGALLDVTNLEAREWYLGQLEDLKSEYGVDSFKFDAGEASWLPSWRKTSTTVDNPNDYTKAFCELASISDQDLRIQEVRVGVASQHLPMFVRLMDKESTWSLRNGLKSIIPHVLTFGLIGYSFVLPDMIGGNAYNGIFISSTVWPERELYIRWLQVSALMPAMQFSVTPWHYDAEVVQIALNMCQLHEKYSDTIIQLAKETIETGFPIIRPLWWISSDDSECLTIDSEFMLGDRLLVAPVLEPGARSRDVYLPRGSWRDELRGDIVSGGRWYREVPAGLGDLPHFTRMD